MKLETRATIKRLATLFCSVGTVICYGYLIGGVGGYLAGKGRPVTAALGFFAGSALAAIAIKLWKSYMKDLEDLDGEENGE
ncbi:MAG: hypothetical protein LBT08_05555 [Synergistaceae bacterium]|jgi:4-hydroxybenzoate polyprenyltransferase|nr:hypothetical protein [Synergistaceae bacterium]